jgi:hypothetical protein
MSTESKDDGRPECNEWLYLISIFDLVRIWYSSSESKDDSNGGTLCDYDIFGLVGHTK